MWGIPGRNSGKLNPMGQCWSPSDGGLWSGEQQVRWQHKETKPQEIHSEKSWPEGEQLSSTRRVHGAQLIWYQEKPQSPGGPILGEPTEPRVLPFPATMSGPRLMAQLCSPEFRGASWQESGVLQEVGSEFQNAEIQVRRYDNRNSRVLGCSPSLFY